MDRSKQIEELLKEGMLLFENEEDDKAIVKFKKVLELDSSNAIAIKRIGDIHYLSDKIEQALKLYKEALEKAPQDISILQTIGNVSLEIKEYDTAIHYFKKVLEINPKNADGWYNLGYAYYYKKDFERAIRQFEKVLEIVQDDCFALLRIAVCHKELARKEQMIIYLTRARKTTCEEAEFWLELGKVHKSEGYFEEAIECFQKVIALEPADEITQFNVYSLYLIGDTFEDLSKPHQAIEYYCKCAEKNENNPYVWMRLADLYYSLDEFEKTKEALLKILKLFPKDCASLNNLGHIYEKLGEKTKAIETWEKSLKVDSNQAETLASLAELVEKQGQKKKAFEYLKKALEVDPENKEIAKKIKRLETKDK